MTAKQPETAQYSLAGIALRLILGLPPLIWAAQSYGEQYVDFWLPWYRVVLECALPDYAVDSLGLTQRHGEYLIAGEFRIKHPLPVHGRVLPAGAGVSASTLMAHALKPPLILAAAALAWPGLTGRGRVLRLLLSLPFLPLLETLDVPLVLASAVNDMVSWMASPAADAASKRADWASVLDGGGRMALGIAAAVGAAAMQRWIGVALRQR